jgi:sterol desaturase/sphingolipid hydroxylase (fatty acid hydroxylase superfamily)
MSTFLIWVFYSNILPIHNHLGFEIPYLFFLFPPASKHDFHHENPVNEMYGKNSIFDYLLGTDKRWRASEARKNLVAQQAKKTIESSLKQD